MISTPGNIRALLAKEMEKKEIQEGLIRACGCIDLIIEILRGSRSQKQVKDCLTMGITEGIRFKTKTSERSAKKLCFTQRQAAAILEMRLYRLNRTGDSGTGAGVSGYSEKD